MGITGGQPMRIYEITVIDDRHEQQGIELTIPDYAIPQGLYTSINGVKKFTRISRSIFVLH